LCSNYKVRCKAKTIELQSNENKQESKGANMIATYKMASKAQSS